MSVRRLPERPNLDQLKRQAKELLTAWRGASEDVPRPGTPLRLRDAQRALAQQYGFDSWDGLRAHVESISGPSNRSQRTRKVYVNGELRHVWREDYAGMRSRIGIGVQRSEITIRALRVDGVRPLESGIVKGSDPDRTGLSRTR